MTAHRPAGSIEDRLLQVIQLLPPADVERETGKNHGSFYADSNPNLRNRLALEDAIALDNLLPKYGQPRLFTRLWRDMTAENEHPNAMLDIESALLMGVKEVGELADAIRLALEDGNLNMDERRRIAREAQDVVDVMLGIRDAVQPPAGPKVVA